MRFANLVLDDISVLFNGGIVAKGALNGCISGILWRVPQRLDGE